MSSVNKVILVGNLGKDPEVRYTQEGAPVASFSLATSEKWKDKSGNAQESTEWHNITAWNKLADVCKQYLSKGSKVYIEGRIKTQTWNDREGNPRKTTNIVVTNLVMLGGAKKDAEPTQAEQESGAYDGGISDSDIPF